MLYAEALDWLALHPDGTYVDATYGAGGHARAILERIPAGRLIAMDTDPSVQTYLISNPSFTFVHANFRRLDVVLDDLGVQKIDGILYDLGASSMQLNEGQRGFSFTQESELDMRMDQTSGGSAYDILATASESELSDIFFYYGQEQAARRIARAIVRRREAGRLPTTTLEFAGLVSGLLQRPGRRERIHPATRTFQALRIAVNDELDALRESLTAAVGRLRSAGRIVAISFHSLEDRVVKTTFRDDERLNVLIKKPVLPAQSEIERNPRARSAKMRAAERKAG